MGYTSYKRGNRPVGPKCPKCKSKNTEVLCCGDLDAKDHGVPYDVDFEQCYCKTCNHVWYIQEVLTFGDVEELKIKEIGIRKVLGASMSGIVFLLNREFIKWVIIANLIAWPIGWYAMNKWLQDFAYRTDIKFWMFPAAGLLALIIAVLAISYQVIKAAAANPVESLRYE